MTFMAVNYNWDQSGTSQQSTMKSVPLDASHILVLYGGINQ